jgi:hypothetical protein
VHVNQSVKKRLTTLRDRCGSVVDGSGGHALHNLPGSVSHGFSRSLSLVVARSELASPHLHSLYDYDDN